MNVLRLEIGKVGEDFRFGNSRRQHLQDVLDPDTHSPNAGPPPALFGVKGDPIEVAHAIYLTLNCLANKPGLRL